MEQAKKDCGELEKELEGAGLIGANISKLRDKIDSLIQELATTEFEEKQLGEQLSPYEVVFKEIV